MSLAVGAMTNTITVTTAPPLVNITSETLGCTISPDEVNNLPLVNRNAYTQLTLTPGIQSNSASSQSNPNGTPNFVIGVPSTQVIVNGGVDGEVPMVSFYKRAVITDERGRRARYFAVYPASLKKGLVETRGSDSVPMVRDMRSKQVALRKRSFRATGRR